MELKTQEEENRRNKEDQQRGKVFKTKDKNKVELKTKAGKNKANKGDQQRGKVWQFSSATVAILLPARKIADK